MPVLRTLVAHKANTSILVDGTTYQINKDCEADVSAKHAVRLLANPNWRNTADRKPVRKPVKDAPKASGKIKLIDSEGQVLEDQVEEKPEEKPTESGKVIDPPIPDDSEAWSDPKEEYSIKWLRACADAYEIKRPKNTGKAKLVEKILAAMYD